MFSIIKFEFQSISSFNQFQICRQTFAHASIRAPKSYIVVLVDERSTVVVLVFRQLCESPDDISLTAVTAAGVLVCVFACFFDYIAYNFLVLLQMSHRPFCRCRLCPFLVIHFSAMRSYKIDVVDPLCILHEIFNRHLFG